MNLSRDVLIASVAALLLTTARAQTPTTQSPPAQTQTPVKPPATKPSADSLYFAVEIIVGAAWDTSKSTHEQAWFHEHSANLRHLRESGALVLGARYSDRGFLVLKAPTEQEAHAMMQADPAMQHGVFTYSLYEFNVFYSGSVEAKRK